MVYVVILNGGVAGVPSVVVIGAAYQVVPLFVVMNLRTSVPEDSRVGAEPPAQLVVTGHVWVWLPPLVSTRVKEAEVLAVEGVVTLHVVAPVVVAVMTLPRVRSMVVAPVALPRAFTDSDWPRRTALSKRALPKSKRVAESLIATCKKCASLARWVHCTSGVVRR